MPMRRAVPEAIRAAMIAALVCLTPGAARAEDRVASLTAGLEFFDPDTGAVMRPESGRPVGLRVTLRDAVTGRAPRGVALAGWIRPDSAGNTSCEDAARGFRVTRRIPLGATDLNGVLLFSANRDGSLGVIDPKLNLQSSNMIAAAVQTQVPDTIAVDTARMRALLRFAGKDGLTAFSLLTGAVTPVAPDLSQPSDIVASDGIGVWAASGDGTIRRIGGPALAPIAVAPGPGPVELRLPADPDVGLLAGFGRGGGLVVVEGATGRIVLSDPARAPFADLGVLPDGTVLGLSGDGRQGRILFPDDPGREITVPLGFRAARLRISPDGRFAAAFAPGGRGIALLDPARAQVLQALELTDGGVTDFVFTDDAGYLLSLDGGFAGLIDLGSIRQGVGAQIRKVDLGRKSATPPAGAQLLMPLWPSPQVLAVDPETQTGWILHDAQAVGEMPPMESLRLRSGIPQKVAVADRSFREVQGGVFETVGVIAGGPHELILTTGIGGLTACLGFDVRGGADRAQAQAIMLSVVSADGVYRAGREEALSFIFHDISGTPIRVERAEFVVPSLSTSWVGRLVARPGPDGRLQARLRFPHAGPFAVYPVGLPPDLKLGSAVLLEVK